MCIWWTASYCINHTHFGQSQNGLEPQFLQFWLWESYKYSIGFNSYKNSVLSCCNSTTVKMGGYGLPGSIFGLPFSLPLCWHGWQMPALLPKAASLLSPPTSPPLPPPANHPLLLLKMQHTWITPQLSQLPGPNLIKQLGHLVNNQSPSKDKCGLNGVSCTAVRRVKGNGFRIR